MFMRFLTSLRVQGGREGSGVSSAFSASQINNFGRLARWMRCHFRPAGSRRKECTAVQAPGRVLWGKRESIHMGLFCPPSFVIAPGNFAAPLPPQLYKVGLKTPMICPFHNFRSRLQPMFSMVCRLQHQPNHCLYWSLPGCRPGEGTHTYS
jgi:hypothetical protein